MTNKILIDRAEVEQALAWLEALTSDTGRFESEVPPIAALRAALAEQPAEQVPVTDLKERCAEILAWQKTGILHGDALRQYANRLYGDDPYAIQMAEAQTARDAYKWITAALAEQPAEQEPLAHDEDLLERLYWEFDHQRKKTGEERMAFKGKMRFYASDFRRVSEGGAAFAQSVTDDMMNLADRLGSEYDDVDPKAWKHLLVYTPQPPKPAEPADEPKVQHRHEWFRTGAMEPGQMRCITCGIWGQEAPQPRRNVTYVCPVCAASLERQE